MECTDVVENFYGVYLLKSLNPKYKGRVYIGYTVDPNRRILQHNRGKQFGGAWRTSKRGPWEMVLTVHGFPSDVSALRFEWAWQHPKKSRRLKFKVKNKKASESSLEYNIGIMFTMLSTSPWNRLPLTIRWLSADAVIDAPANLAPPAHMPVVFGTVLSKKIRGNQRKEENAESNEITCDSFICQICRKIMTEEDTLCCVNPNCRGSWHLICLANKFLEEEQSYAVTKVGQSRSQIRKYIIPVEGTCPLCKLSLLWGDLIRKKNGCYADIRETN